MKNTALRILILCLWMTLAVAAAQIELLDEVNAERWLISLADSCNLMPPQNDPARTADPAHPDTFLFQYPFGIIKTRGTDKMQKDQILEVNLRTRDVADPFGRHVGDLMTPFINEGTVFSGTLHLLGLQEAGHAWCWGLSDGQSLCGIEWNTYVPSVDQQAVLYSLSYTLSQNQEITEMTFSQVLLTQLQAEADLAAAVAYRDQQKGSEGTPPAPEELTLNGRPVLDIQASELVAALGEPAEVQDLPNGQGRMLLYDGMVAQLGLNVLSGEEVVRQVVVYGENLEGPRGIRIGMDAASVLTLLTGKTETALREDVLYRQEDSQGNIFGAEVIQNGTDLLQLRVWTVHTDHTSTVLSVDFREGRLLQFSLSHEN